MAKTHMMPFGIPDRFYGFQEFERLMTKIRITSCHAPLVKGAQAGKIIALEGGMFCTPGEECSHETFIEIGPIEQLSLCLTSKCGRVIHEPSKEAEETLVGASERRSSPFCELIGHVQFEKMSSARCQKGYCSYLIEKIPVENEAYACLRRPTKPPYGTACLDR